MSSGSRRISVALCTYNGGAWLREQLQSLTCQTRLPDELVAFDDCSTDNTVRILRDFAARAPFPVRTEENRGTVGAAANFGLAIAACTGDIIALCDQDDVWAPEKLARIESAFTSRPDLGLLFSDAEICDEDCRPLGYRLWQSVRFGARLRRRVARGEAFDVILRQNVVTGATTAFAARLRPLVLPIDPHWIHDGWIAILAAAVSPVTVIPRPLVRYRQHSRQAIGALQRTLYEQYLAARRMDRDVFARQARMYEAVAERLSCAAARSGFAFPPRSMEILRQKIEHCRLRSAIRRREIPRVAPAFGELFTLRYRRFSLGWKSFAQDLLL